MQERVLAVVLLLDLREASLVLASCVALTTETWSLLQPDILQ